MTISLHAHLLGLGAEVLKGWLRRVGALDKKHTRKEQFAQAIEQQLTLNLRHVVACLSQAEKQFLAESVHQKRLISQREFTAKYGRACPMPKGYYEWGEAISLLAPMIHFADRWEVDGTHLVPELVEPLRALLPKPTDIKARIVNAVPKAWPSEQQGVGGDPIRPIHVFESERIAPAELRRVLRLIQGGKVKVTDASHRPTDATTRLVREVLVVPDFELEIPEGHSRGVWDQHPYSHVGPVRAHAWPVLVQQCGWAKVKGGALVLTEAGKGLLQAFVPEVFRDGVARYLGNDDFDELNRVNHIRGQSGKAKRWLSHPSCRKTVIAEAMEAFPVGEWLEYKEACRLVEAAPEAWDVLETNRPVLYFFEPQYGFITDNLGLGRQFLRAFFLESLATLGVLDAACVYPHWLWPDLRDSLAGDLPFCGRYDGLMYVRLNPLGAYALGFTNQYDQRAEDRPQLFRVLPNHDLVLANGPLNAADRASLELLAAPKSEVVWTLDADRMLTHVETGGTFAELRAFLEANAVENLPENVRVFLDELERKLTAGPSCRDALLVEWNDAALAQLIATSAGTQRLCFHAGENRLVVPKENLAAFARAVKKLGYVLPPAAV